MISAVDMLVIVIPLMWWCGVASLPQLGRLRLPRMEISDKLARSRQHSLGQEQHLGSLIAENG